MPRKCPFTGKQTHAGHQYARRGKAKYLGGVGIKITGKTKRKFKANMQRVSREDQRLGQGDPQRVHRQASQARLHARRARQARRDLTAPPHPERSRT